MAEHALINGYLDHLTGRLPAEVVDELSDGLHEAFQRNLQRGLDSDSAAAAAVQDFGQPADVTAAFALHSPGHRAAVRLLASGPVFAAVWGASLITAQAWTWSIPRAATVCFASTLVLTAAALAMVARSNEPRRGRLTAPASLSLMVLDATMVLTVVLAAPVLTWPMALAIPASLIRLTLAARTLPHPLHS